MQKPKEKGQKYYKTIYKTPLKRLQFEQHEPHFKTGGDLRCSGKVGNSWSTCDTIMLLLNDMNNIWHENNTGHQFT
jgi:hypothetical protein